MEIRSDFWVLEKGPSYSPEWLCRKCQHNRKSDSVTNILYADRYKSKAEAVANAPDADWKPRFVNWFEKYV